MWPTATLLVALAVGACGGDDPPLECNTQVTPACAPLYPPTFANVYSMTLAMKCGSGARSCHSDSGMKGGMTFSTMDNAYEALLEPGQDRVIPGDPACSIMIIRTHATDFSIKMPPGSSLQAPELCALVQWVANGAERTPGAFDAAVPDASPADASIDATIDATIVGAAPMTRLVLAASVLLAACGGTSHDYLPTEELMKPEACMECHPKHFTEWSGSMHAYAADDPVFLAMNARGQTDTGGALGDFCVNCHAPMAVRLGLTTDGLNLSTLPQHVKGVTCFFCHSVDTVTGDHNNPLVLAADDTMRGGLRDPDPVDSPAHRSMYSAYVDADAPESAGMCGACHDFQNSKGVHLERTFEEWKTTIFGKLERPMSFLTCGECHMTPITDVVADVPDIDVPQRELGRRNHSFPGIDVALTAWPQQAEQLAAIEAFLKPTLNPKLCYNMKNDLQYTLDNVGSGHMFPSGAAQDRRAWAEVIAYDANDNVLYSSGVVAPGTDPDPAEPDLFRFWDDIYDDAGNPTHLFWEVASHDDSTLLKPTTTTCPTTPGFFHATIHDYNVTLNFADVARITARVLIRPMPYELLDDLGIDPAVQGMMPTHELTGTKVEWTPAAVDGCVTLPRGGIPTPICP